jgi:hypothetical protein
MFYTSKERDGQPFRFVGFGAGQANANIVQLDEELPPVLPSAKVRWTDFRFYGHMAGLGYVKGSLNERRESAVTLRALTNENLFPAHFYNELYVSVHPVGRRFLRYENVAPIEVHAPSVLSAPPQPEMVAKQMKDADLFERVSRVPLGPRSIQIQEAEQRFLSPAGLGIERLDSPRPGEITFRITSHLEQTATIAHFVHVTGAVPTTMRGADGIIDIEPDESREFTMKIPFAPGSVVDSRVYVFAVVVGPAEVEGYERIEFELSS